MGEFISLKGDGMYWVKTKWIIGAGDWLNDKMGEFGPFNTREDAEKCVVSLASRETIVSAKIVQDETSLGIEK